MITSIQFAISIEQTALTSDEDVLTLQHHLTHAARNFSGGEALVSVTGYEGQLDDGGKQNE